MSLNWYQQGSYTDNVPSSQISLQGKVIYIMTRIKILLQKKLRRVFMGKY